MRLVKLDVQDGPPIYINPEHVVAVRKALKDTKVETVSGSSHIVRDDPEVVARLLGAEEQAIDLNPRLVHQR